MDEINRLEDVRPGDILFGPIGGLVGVGVGLGQLALREAFRIGRLSVRHVGIVVEAAGYSPPGTIRNGETNDIAVVYGPRLVQAMPHGAEEIEMRQDTHWTPRHVFMRMPEDYPGQAEDAGAIARLMVREGVAYSFASYYALAKWRWGIGRGHAETANGVETWVPSDLEKWIARRREPQPLFGSHRPALSTGYAERPMVQLPVEAICSVLVDQAWSLAGKRVMVGTKPQVVTPGAMAIQLWNRPNVVRGGAGLL
jgi:hypothetical protein